MDRSKIIKMIIVLACITILAGSLLRITRHNSMSLTEYAALQSSTGEQLAEDATSSTDGTDTGDDNGSASTPENGNSNSSADGEISGPGVEAGSPDTSGPDEGQATDPLLTGAFLNGTSQLEDRIVLAEGFYYEPISDDLRRYMTGISYPVTEGEDAVTDPAITFAELRYLHILHYNFDGETAQGELVCNAAIAQDLVEIFHELYCNEYQLEKVLLIDTYDGDDNASMEDNNTSCFNYRVVEGTTKLSRHAYGLAVDVNPLYNPYITYEKDGTEQVSPVSALPYADRSARFAYKIDKEDLCYRLFIDHGFTWGGNWNSSKDYQHFQKNLP